MPYSNNNRLRRDEVLSRYFPQYYPVVANQSGLSGGSCIIEHDTHRLVLRCHHDPDAPESHFLRHYHALKHLPESLAPRPRFYIRGWMAVDFFTVRLNPDYRTPTNSLAYCIICTNNPNWAGESVCCRYSNSTGSVAIRRVVRHAGCER